MKKLFLFLLIVCSLASNAQTGTYQTFNYYGGRFKRIISDSAQGIPLDTFAIRVTERNLPYIASKGDTIYLWSTAQQKWIIGSGSGADSSVFATRNWSNTQFVLLAGSYANPSWITSLAWSKITGAPPEFAPSASSAYYVQNQQNSQQNANYWVKRGRVTKLTADSTVILTPLTTIPSLANGEIAYDNTNAQYYGGRGGANKKFIMDGDIGYLTGKLITVDKDAANSTDTRTGINKYNSFYPFKTIAAAAAAMTDGDVLNVKAGTYTNDSLIINNSAYTNAVYFEGVTLTGNIKMKGKIFVTNTTLNSYIYLYYAGADIASGNLISGLDKGSSVINGRIEVSSSPGSDYLTIRHLGRITTPASGTTAGTTLLGTNTRFFIDGISKIENLATSGNNRILQGGQLYASNVGTITMENTTTSVMFFSTSVYLKGIDLVEYKGSGYIAGGFGSFLRYAENTTFKASTATYLFFADGNNGAVSTTFKNCKLINTKATGYTYSLAYSPGSPAQNKSLYFYDCQFQNTNNSGANYILQITNNDLLNIHWVNNISNQNTATYWTGTLSTPPTVEIVSNYTYHSSFIIQQPPIFN
jgi:hypothetical protein